MTAPDTPTERPIRARRLIPVACTLADPQAGERIDEWRQALHGLVTGTERRRPGQLRLALADDSDRIGALVSLAKAEKACCPFFDFTLDIGAEVITLLIDVPVGSEDVLDDVARLATAT